VAANALMPISLIKNPDNKTFVNANELFKTAKSLGISSFALLVRALNLNLISINVYQKLKREADFEYKAFLKREEEKKAKQKEKDKPGGPDYFLLQLNRNSRLFTQTVLDAFRGGFIEPTQASSLLNVQITKFQKLEAQLYK
jgi:Zn-dependent peptidase ImmA (M78 family)